MVKINVSPREGYCSLQSANYGVREEGEFADVNNVCGAVSTFFREVAWTVQSGISRLCSAGVSKYLDLDPMEGKDGLVVCFHGLNANPTVWNDHVDQFKKLEEKNGDVSLAYYTPVIPNMGHCTMHDAGIDEIVRKIELWIAQHPGKPVVIVGQSFGSRVSVEVECRLRKSAPQTPVSLSLTGPVLYGTSFVDKIVDTLGREAATQWSFGLLSSVAIDELKQGSDASKELLEKAREAVPEGCAERRYRMYAPVQDSLIWEKGSALPILNPTGDPKKNEKHYLVTGFGHNTIIDAFTQEQVEKNFHWINRNNNREFTKLECAHCLTKSSDAGGTLAAPEEKRVVLLQVAHRVSMIFNMVGMLILRIYDCLKSLWMGETFLTAVKDERDGNYHYKLTDLPWNKPRTEPSQGLNLCIHGLFGNPLHFKRYVSQLQKDHPEMDTVAPQVVLRGNCPLEVAAEPILEIVEDYLRKNPGCPVNIIGTSNGGRIAAYLESRIDPALLAGSSLKITSIAGVHYGTQFVNALKNMGIHSVSPLDPALATEFEWGSNTAQKLHKEWRDKQLVWLEHNCKVQHLFCATTEDDKVLTISAALPLPPDAVTGSDNLKYTHKIYHGESHTSVVENAQDDVMQWLFSVNV